jgi:N6-L-threonylcarbamoyladenine synthase
MLRENNFNFSFSGLKTAVLYKVKDLGLTRPANGGEIKDQLVVNDLCASFEQAVVDVLVGKTVRAAQKYNAKSISLSGGVAANLALRNQLSDMCNKLAVKFFVPPQNLCTDNAEMIGIAAGFMLSKGFKPVSYKKVKADSNLQL